MSETAPRGVIHDLGYKRYLGVRRPQSTRNRVIARHMLGAAWRGWWRMKIWVVLAGMVVTGMGVAMYVLLFISRNPVVTEMAARGGRELRWADAMLPLAVDGMTALGFILTLTVVARQIADDTRTGAFEFYFSRPLRPVDYALGKAFGAIAIVGCIVFLGPTLVALTRVAMAATRNELATVLPLLPAALAIGAVSAVVYGVIPLAFGTLTRRRGYAIGGWAAFYIIFGTMASGAAALGRISALSALDVKASIEALAYALFDVEPLLAGQLNNLVPPVWAACAALAGYVAIAFGVVYWRVRRAEHAGMGGA